jgi:hypothetical protein
MSTDKKIRDAYDAAAVEIYAFKEPYQFLPEFPRALAVQFGATRSGGLASFESLGPKSLAHLRAIYTVYKAGFFQRLLLKRSMAPTERQLYNEYVARRKGMFNEAIQTFSPPKPAVVSEPPKYPKPKKKKHTWGRGPQWPYDSRGDDDLASVPADKVWITDVMKDSDLSYHFQSDMMQKISAYPSYPGGLVFKKDPTPEDKAHLDLLDRYSKLCYAYRKGASILDTDLLSDEAVLERVIHPVDPLPHLFHSSFLLVSDAVRDVLQGFDLGKTAFRKVTLVNPFKKCRHPDYNYLNVFEIKPVVSVEDSQGLRSPGLKLSYYNFSLTEDDLIAVKGSALEGSDLWLDPTLSEALFLSDRLHTALVESGLVPEVRFARCRIV